MEVWAPQWAGRWWFRLVRNDEGLHLVRSTVLTGRGHLFRPGIKEAEDRDEPTFSWYQPSPDGRFIAYGAPEGGGLQGGVQLLRLRIFDTEIRDDLPVRLGHVAAGLAWLPDASGFYYMHGLSYANQDPERRVALHLLGAPHGSVDQPLRGLGFDTRLQISPDGNFVAVLTGTREPRADWLLHRSTGHWQAFLTHVPATCFGTFAGEYYIALTTWKSPRGRIVSIPILTARQVETWKEIVPEGDGVIRSICMVGEHIVVGSLHDTNTQIRVYCADGTLQADVPLPGSGSVAVSGAAGWLQALATPMVSPGKDGFALVHSDYDRAPSVYWHDISKRRLQSCGAVAATFAGIVSRCERMPAGDGVDIPITLVHRSDCRWPAPTIIYCYGAYNFALVPAWIGPLGPFVEAGGVAVFAHLRGGGEYGAAWWRAGHHEHKQRSFDDIYAVAEGLIAAGLTSSAQLAIVGLSNGGTNVCTALVQRPDLFRAGAALAPHCDLLRYSRDPFCGGAPIEGHHQGLHVNAGTWRDRDWGRGSATDRCLVQAHFPQSMYPDPLCYSPYNLVCCGTEYSALLMVSGTEDVWCPPWHSRKFAARLQASTASGRPILLRVWEDKGHDHPISDPEQVAEWLTFVMDELGLYRYATGQ
jgi:prolyl oligopeptidase